MTFQETTLGSIYNQLLYLSGQDSTSLQIADAVRLFNYALNDYMQIAMQHDRTWKWDDSANTGAPEALVNVVAGTSDYAITYIDVDAVHYLDSQSGLYRPLERLIGQDDDGTAFTGRSGTPTHFSLTGNYLRLYPTPSTSITSGLKLFVTKGGNHIASTSLSTALGIPAIHTNYLVYHALNDLVVRTKDGTLVHETLQQLTKDVARYFQKRGGQSSTRLRAKSRAGR